MARAHQRLRHPAQLLAHLLDELRLLGVPLTGGLGLLVQCDCFTVEKLATLYGDAFPHGRPLTAMVANGLRNGLQIPSADSLITWASTVSSFWKNAFVHELAGRMGLPMDRTTGTKVREHLAGRTTLGHDEFWSPYNSGIRSSCERAKQNFEERLKVWVRPRDSHYPTD